jgi:DNA (cytosine-5)-methyltransferase 1
MEPVVPPEPVFYNDNCSHVVAWLRNLTSAGHLPAGVVDDRDIERITPDALKGFKECHFFAGVGGWLLALRLAGWPLGRPVWTGSCPCQPFSSAGKRKGTADSRHLWPAFLRLIKECRPPTIFGEQVASKLGRKWLARVHFDLEALGYGVGAADLCGPCVGAPHIRQRLYWVADRVGHADAGRRPQGEAVPRRPPAGPGLPVPPGGLGHPSGNGREQGPPGPLRTQLDSGGASSGFWDTYDLVHCRDGKFRRTQPGLQCLVDGSSFRLADGRSRQDVSRSAILRGIGNAIVPQVAAMFVRAYLGR